MFWPLRYCCRSAIFFSVLAISSRYFLIFLLKCFNASTIALSLSSGHCGCLLSSFLGKLFLFQLGQKNYRLNMYIKLKHIPTKLQISRQYYYSTNTVRLTLFTQVLLVTAISFPSIFSAFYLVLIFVYAPSPFLLSLN